MKTYAIEFEGISELFFGGKIQSKKQPNETHEQLEERCWMERAHVNEQGQLFLNPFALKIAFETASRQLQQKIPGSKGQTFTKVFMTGTLSADPMILCNGNGKPATAKCIVERRMFVPSDGKRGSGKRVERIFPVIQKWSTVGQLIVFNEKITPEVLAEHAEQVSKFVGFGAMRVENGGINGRSKVVKITAT